MEATMIGQRYTLNWIVTVVDDLFVEPGVVWLDPEGNQLNFSLQRMGSTSTLTLTFDSLAPSDAGQRICKACISVDVVGIRDHCDSTMADITFTGMHYYVSGCVHKKYLTSLIPWC